MNEINNFAYWMAISHLPNWKRKRINNLIFKKIFSSNLYLSDFFSMETGDWNALYDFSDKELKDLIVAKKELPKYSFLAEDLINQGYQLIPINSKEYPKMLTENLTEILAPALLYIKGNHHLLNEPSTAIIGSRKASQPALQFTENISQKVSLENRVVVSGFAKGVDRTALNKALQYNGRSIIVLPQGILTFTNGFKQYYQHIIQGDVLVMSPYPPLAPWSIGLAMGRNSIIYGMAETIYVAESSSSGGTWSGVLNGIQKKRTIYIRNPNPKENNANDLLIMMGAIPVDMHGEIDHSPALENFQDELINKLSKNALTIEEILLETQIDIKPSKLQLYLDKLEDIEEVRVEDKIKYKVKFKDYEQSSLFNS